jgi:CRISPR system Cascade subunit CasD
MQYCKDWNKERTMTYTLLLRLVAPMQSWGVQSNFDYRDTGLEPSKSGVVGLLCAASGISREAPLDPRLPASRMGVRVDCEGVVAYDYHVAGVGGMLKADGKVKADNVVPSWRYYLADAAFLVGLENEDKRWLHTLYEALQHPVWPLFFGRKAFPPGEPVALSDRAIADQDLFSALNTYPRLRKDPRTLGPSRMRGLLEDPLGSIVRMDQPVSFARGKRQFGLRRLKPVTFHVMEKGENDHD